MQVTLTYKTFFQKFLGESGIFITGSTSLLYNTHKKTENKIKKKKTWFSVLNNYYNDVEKNRIWEKKKLSLNLETFYFG